MSGNLWFSFLFTVRSSKIRKLRDRRTSSQGVREVLGLSRVSMWPNVLPGRSCPELRPPCFCQGFQKGTQGFRILTLAQSRFHFCPQPYWVPLIPSLQRANQGWGQGWPGNKSHTETLTPMCGTWREGLWEPAGSWGGACMNGISALGRRGQRPFCHVRMRWRDSACNGKRAPARTDCIGTWPQTSSLRTVRNTFQFLISHLVYGALSQNPS